MRRFDFDGLSDRHEPSAAGVIVRSRQCINSGAIQGCRENDRRNHDREERKEFSEHFQVHSPRCRAAGPLTGERIADGTATRNGTVRLPD